MRHGTRAAYERGCRETDCRAANALYHRLRRGTDRDLSGLTHGKRSTYVNYGCPCEPCREANQLYMAAWRGAA